MRLSRFVLGLCMLPGVALAEPLIDGASKEGASFAIVEQAFRARVAEAFPAGTPLADVTARLTAEGFTMLDGYGEFVDHGWVCDVIWRVLWTEVDGKATDIDVMHNGVCL